MSQTLSGLVDAAELAAKNLSSLYGKLGSLASKATRLLDDGKRDEADALEAEAQDMEPTVEAARDALEEALRAAQSALHLPINLDNPVAEANMLRMDCELRGTDLSTEVK